MAEGSVDRIDLMGADGWHKRLDDDLTWVWQTGRTSTKSLPWWPGLDQRIADFHARYERACIED